MKFRRSKNSWITPSEVMEYLYCPRFTYFMNSLLIPQNEENRYKVMMGRNIHKIKTRINKDYLRKKIGVIKKEVNQYLSSSEYGIRGIVDEVLWLDNGTISPLDYKFAEYKNKIYSTYKFQSVMYAILIEKNFDKPVKIGYICYVRSKSRLEKIEITDNDKNEVIKIIVKMFRIIELSEFPGRTRIRSRCIDCCYRNICIK